MPIWPCDLANLSPIFPVFLLLANCVLPIWSQATCAFIRADFAEFLVGDTPAEPQIADHLFLCRSFLRRPSAVSCCTRQMETKFEQFAREQLHSAVSAEIGIIRNFFIEWSSKFRMEFSQSLNRTERTLRHIYKRTYGHFFTQNIGMFNFFFSHLRSLIFSPFCQFSADSFGDAFRQLLQRMFLAEFALLNPLHDLSSHEQCMLNFFSAFAPFGSVPDAIVALHGRTFAAWISFIDALDSAGEAVQSLGKNFFLSPHCVHSVVRMRFCPICLGHSPQIRPCPTFCHNVLNSCLHNLTTISFHWERLIDSLVRLSDSLVSVHNVHLSLAPFPFQLSEAIMHFQENDKNISGRILFRCFGDELKKIATDGQINLRKRRRSNLETKEYLEEEENDEEEDEKEEEEEEKEQEEKVEHGQEESRQTVDNGLKVVESDGHTFPSSPPLLVSVLSLRRSIDFFVDRLLRMKGFWRGMGLMLCQEGGIQAEEVGPGRAEGEENCWEGIGKQEEGTGESDGEKEQQQEKANFMREITQQMDAIVKRVQIANGIETEGKSGTEWPAEKANATENDGRNSEEQDDINSSADDYPSAEDYHSYESVGKWWQWTELETTQTERNNGKRRTEEGIGTALAISFTLLSLLFWCY